MASKKDSHNHDRELYIVELEKKLDEQDAKLRLLSNEVEKYKQIVQPLTNFVFGLRSAGLEEDLTDGNASKRIKKMAISAEPCAGNARLEDLNLEKHPKSER